MSEQLITTPGIFGENGNFLLERELGSGGMGGVYLGRDKMLDRPVAVKIMLREYGADAEFLEKFKREAQAAAKLIHPNIAQVYSYGICDGMPYIAMELVAGGSLWSIMSNSGGKTDVPRVLKICQQIAQALQCSSDMGFVHGDVKPENILLDANGNAKLVDFGLAGMQMNADEIWGTPYYISPERVKKEPVDYRADMYSLGGTLYHALTGVPPFDGDDSIAVVKKRFEGAPRKPSEIRPELTPAIDNLVLKMLALDKNDRFPSFEALLQAFKEVLTTGLTQKIPDAPTSGASAKPATSGRRMVVRGRRTAVAMRRPGGVKKRLAEDVAIENEDKGTSESLSQEDEEEEEGGSLGLKVTMFVLGGLLVIGAIAGGLFWFIQSNKASEQAEVRAQIESGYDKAKTSITDTMGMAEKFASEMDGFAALAVQECEKVTAELKNILPEDQRTLLKPDLSQELIDAIALTNGAPVAAAAPAADSTKTNAVPTNVVAQVSSTTNAPAAAKGKDEKQAAGLAKDAKDVKGTKGANDTKDVKAAAEPQPKAEISQDVLNVHELWNRAYSCQASAIQVRHSVKALQKLVPAEIKDRASASKEDVEKLAEISRNLVESLEAIRQSKHLDNIKTGVQLIRKKGPKLVEQITKRLSIEKKEQARKAKAEAEAAAEQARKAKAAEEHKKLVDSEIAEVAEKFKQLIANGNFRQLDWKGAIRQLNHLTNDFQTAEGQLAVELNIRKVNAMKDMQDILVNNGEGFVFRVSKLKGTKIVSVNDKDVTLLKGKDKHRVHWEKFYREYPGNLNELINQFVVLGRKNSKPALNLKDWANAMTGSALTMKIIFAEDSNAQLRSEQLAKEVVKQFPDYVKVMRDIFPDLKFEVEEE